MNWIRLPVLLPLAAAMLPLLCGCAREAASKQVPKGLETPPAEAGELVVLTWENYLALSVLDNFERQTGIKVVYEKVENSRQFSQLLASSPERYDVIIADDKTLIEMNALKLLQPIDKTLLGNLPNLGKDFLGCDFDPGNEFSIPYNWGLACIAYREDLVKSPRHSWEILWDESLKGKVTLLDEPDDLFFITLLALGHQPEEAPPEAFEDARRKLLLLVEEQESEPMELYEGIERLLAGETSVLLTYNCDAVEQMLADERVRAFIPAEGSPLWVDSFALCRQSRNKETAHRFINFLLEPANAAATANEKYIPTPNVPARKFLRPDLVSNPLLFPPPELLGKCKFIRFEGENRRLVDAGMREFYQRVREKKKCPETIQAPPGARQPD
jgi:spermidine/putrescine transport system substrate-binding protein